MDYSWINTALLVTGVATIIAPIAIILWMFWQSIGWRWCVIVALGIVVVELFGYMGIGAIVEYFGW